MVSAAVICDLNAKGLLVCAHPEDYLAVGYNKFELERQLCATGALHLEVPHCTDVALCMQAAQWFRSTASLLLHGFRT